jgi:hypothetical protein
MFRNPFAKFRFNLLRLLYELNLRILWRLQVLARFAGMKEPQRPLISERYSQPLGLTALTFHWGLEKTLNRYRTAINSTDGGDKGDTSGMQPESPMSNQVLTKTHSVHRSDAN